MTQAPPDTDQQMRAHFVHNGTRVIQCGSLDNQETGILVRDPVPAFAHAHARAPARALAPAPVPALALLLFVRLLLCLLLCLLLLLLIRLLGWAYGVGLAIR